MYGITLRSIEVTQKKGTLNLVFVKCTGDARRYRGLQSILTQIEELEGREATQSVGKCGWTEREYEAQLGMAERGGGRYRYSFRFLFWYSFRY